MGVSLHELRNKWTYDDVMKANAVLDMYDAMEITSNYVDERELERNRG